MGQNSQSKAIWFILGTFSNDLGFFFPTAECQHSSFVIVTKIEQDFVSKWIWKKKNKNRV
jgi:hypothetical protein